jgi:AbrB family looped-hinge helix DNA binding protein
MPIATARISSKGQVTIPKKIRDYLDSETVVFDLRDGIVVLQPVRDAAGALNKYARHAKQDDFKKLREKAWEDALDEKRRRASS